MTSTRVKVNIYRSDIQAALNKVVRREILRFFRKAKISDVRPTVRWTTAEIHLDSDPHGELMRMIDMHSIEVEVEP